MSQARPPSQELLSQAVDAEHALDPATYEWSVRLFTLVKKLLKVNVKLHGSDALLEEGEIFLFNHFARFETFIPQYLIFLRTGVHCRSVAAHELFVPGEALTGYLLRVGAVPNNHPRLLPLLAAEILRGRKVVLFPEGGMVKDRRVIGPGGSYSIYSRLARERRKHHTGAAVLALTLQAMKLAVLLEHRAGRSLKLERFAAALGIDDVDTLLAAARRPTTIVPANITFYPLHVSDNLLRQGAELLSRGLSKRLSEELLIEGNILLRHTDMDIRLGAPVRPAQRWRWWERRLLERVLPRIGTLEGFFTLRRDEGRLDERVFARRMRRKVLTIRDDYMRRMYAAVTVNLSHLASVLILRLLEVARDDIDAPVLHRMLYLSVKHVQLRPPVHLHRSLRNPEAYRGLLAGSCPGLEQLVASSTERGLVERRDGRYRLLPKLRAEHGFDEVRVENPVAVYANEVGPIRAIGPCIDEAMAEAGAIGARALARLRFDDELIAHEWDRAAFSRPRHAALNGQETASESGEPFLLLPSRRRPLGVLLSHGFLASPAEVRGAAEVLSARGFPVMAPRLAGHGTSPWDLRTRAWQEWMDSVRRGFEVLAPFVERVCLVGFSTGGALSLLLAAEAPAALAGVVAISTPLKFRNRNLVFVPLVHGANRLVRSLSSLEGVMPFRPNASEHPHINYRNIPVRGLYELRRMVDALGRRLGDVRAPALVMQADADPVVEPRSARIIHRRLGSSDKRLHMVAAARHGILHEDLGGTVALVTDFVESLDDRRKRAAGRLE